jgi:hypothetical protein
MNKAEIKANRIMISGKLIEMAAHLRKQADTGIDDGTVLFVNGRIGSEGECVAAVTGNNGNLIDIMATNLISSEPMFNLLASALISSLTADEKKFMNTIAGMFKATENVFTTINYLIAFADVHASANNGTFLSKTTPDFMKQFLEKVIKGWAEKAGFEYNFTLKPINVMDEKLLKKITDLDISVRCLNILQINRIATVGDLVKFSVKQLFALHNMSKRTVREIQELLEEMGLSLKTE